MRVRTGFALPAGNTLADDDWRHAKAGNWIGPPPAIAVISSGRKSINDFGGDFQVAFFLITPGLFNQLARIFQLTTIAQGALCRPLSTCHLSLPGKHSTRADQKDDRLVQFARSRPGDRL